LQRELVISSELENIEKVRLFLKQIFFESEIDFRYFNQVLLGICEAVNNSIIHGNSLNKEKEVIISICFSEGSLIVEVKDEGTGFNLESLDDPTRSENLKKENGRGIYLMRNVADNIQYFEGGRRVSIKYIIV